MPYYHVSAIDLGEEFEFTPRFPETANPSECKETPRVCFSPTVKQCLMGITGTAGISCIIREVIYVAEKNNTLPVVYRTHRRLTAPTKGSKDFERTGEMWSVVPIKCKRYGYIDLDYLLRHRKVRISKTPDVKISREFYDGWLAGQDACNRDWDKEK